MGDIPLNSLNDSEASYIPARIRTRSKFDKIAFGVIVSGIVILITFHLIQFYFVAQVVNSNIWTEVQKIDIGFYQNQIKTLVNHINQTLNQIDHLNISNYEIQVQTLMLNVNQTLVRINTLISQIDHFLPPH